MDKEVMVLILKMATGLSEGTISVFAMSSDIFLSACRSEATASLRAIMSSVYACLLIQIPPDKMEMTVTQEVTTSPGAVGGCSGAAYSSEGQ